MKRVFSVTIHEVQIDVLNIFCNKCNSKSYFRRHFKSIDTI